MWTAGWSKWVAGNRAGARLVTACLAAAVPASASAQLTVAHSATARVEAVALVREVSPLLPAADSAGILSGSVQVVSTAPFGLEVRGDPGSAAVTAVRLPGGRWMPLSADSWLPLAELSNGLHAVRVEYRVEDVPGGVPPSPPAVRAVVR